MNSQRLRLPPYGKELAAMRQSGQAPAQDVVVALDWTLGKVFPRVVVPEDLPAEKIDLSFIAGLWVIIAYRAAQASRVDALAQHALRFCPKALQTINVDCNAVAYLKLGGVA